jgi:3-oxoacyl-[acyl-carrier protein] reductase
MHERIEQAFSLEDRVAVITGAASGIGRESAILLAQAGARVVLGDINEQGLADTARTIGQNASYLRTDVTDRDSIEALAQRALAISGRIDIWANIAGVLIHANVTDVTEEQLDRVIAVNQKGVFWGCATAARIMQKQRSGSIINLTSGAADGPVAGVSVYGMTKSAIATLTRTLAHEMGPYGVRVNAIAPGFIETPMTDFRFRNPDNTIDATKREEVLTLYRQGSVLGLTGVPSDIAFAMLYLASDAARFVTGQTIRPNGGTSML